MEANPLTPSKLLSQLKGHKDKIWNLAWHPNGLLLASCSSDKTIKIWSQDPTNPDNYQLSETLSGEHLKTIRSIVWSSDGLFLASGSFDATVVIYHINGNKFEHIAKLEGHENEVKCVSWDYTNTYLASCSRDKSLMLWDYEKQDNVYDFSCSTVLNGHDQDVKFVKWKPNSQILFSASYDDTIKVWEQDDDDWICVQTLKGHESTVWSLDFTPDGNFMISVGDDQNIKIWDISAKNYINDPILNVATMKGYHDRCIFSCSCSWDGQYLATAGADNRVNLFQRNLDNGENSISFDLIEKKDMAHENDINCVAFHPKINIFATCSDDQMIKIWKINDD